MKPKKNLQETHKSKGFYLENEIAELVNEDIRNGQRGEMTIIINALFKEYYRNQGRLGGGDGMGEKVPVRTFEAFKKEDLLEFINHYSNEDLTGKEILDRLQDYFGLI